jgi:hypothetical protein
MIKQDQKSTACYLTFLLLGLRAFAVSSAITIILTLFMFSLSSPSAYGECGVLCVHEKANSDTELSPSRENIISRYSVADSISTSKDSFDSLSVSLMDSASSSREGSKDYILSANDVDTNSTLSDSDPDDWEFIIISYLWMIGINGDVTVKNTTADLDVGFSDILDNLDFAGEYHIEAWKGNFGVFIDPTLSKLSISEDVEIPVLDPINVELDSKFLLLEFGGLYRVGTWPIGSPNNDLSQRMKPSVTLELLAGGRYWYLKNELDIEGPLGILDREIDDTQNWLDLFVGGRVKLNLTEKLILSVRSDIGGFGFGFSSDFSWNLVGWISYELPWYRITPLIGYRALYVDFKDGSGNDRFEYKTWTTGPLLGLAFRF